MGQSQSSQPPPKAPTIVQYAPLPSSALVSGIGVGGRTQSCQYCLNPSKKDTCGPCKLFVAQGISASGVRMYRETGNVSRDECGRFSADLKLVNEKKLAFEQLKKNLIDGKYFENLQNGYCAQMFVKPGEESKLVDAGSITNERLIKPAIRKMTSGGGYSSTTKLFLKPSIPFRISLNGTTVDVSTMTLFHPSPLRIENVQHDAVLTLNDTASSEAGVVVLIPLIGSIRPKEGGAFFSKLASYIPGVLQPNPATNQYESVEVPTGNDWNLSTLLPGTPDEATKQTVVNAGFFTWKATPPLVETILGTTKNPSPNADILQMGWKPATGVVGPTFVMLEKPIELGVFDLQMIRRLPVTPSEEAMPPPMLDTVTYTAKSKCDAGGVLSGKKEGFDNKCDPFAAMQPVSTITSDTIFSVVLGVMTAVAVFIGLYFALKYASDNNWGTKIQQWGRKAGRYLATAPPPGTESAPAPAPAPKGPVTPSQPRAGEEFAFTNDAAVELRRRKKAEQEELARLKKEADESAAKAKAEEAAQLDILRKQAEEAKARMARPTEPSSGPSKAVPTREGEDFAFSSPLAERQKQKRAEAARVKRQEEASGTGLLTREELERNTKEADARKKAEDTELARLKAEADLAALKQKEEDERIEREQKARQAQRRARTPLQKAEENLRDTNGAIIDISGQLNEAKGHATRYRSQYEEYKDKEPALAKTFKKSAEDYEAEVTRLTNELETANQDKVKITQQIKSLKEEPPKIPKRRIIAEEPPDEEETKKADIDTKLKALETRLKEIQERKRGAQITMRRIVDARNKAKTLRASPPKIPSQADREINRVKAESDKAAAEVEALTKEIEEDVQTQQKFATLMQEQAKKFDVPSSVQTRIQNAVANAEKIETEATKTKEDAEAEREKVARDLAAAQSRLRQSQTIYNRATQRRNLTTGRGRTRRH